MKYIFLLLGKFLKCFDILRLNNLIHTVLDYVNTGFQTKSSNIGSNTRICYPSDKVIGAIFIKIGSNSTIGRRTILTAWKKEKDPSIIIGDNVAIGNDCHITAINRITLGDNVLLGEKVTITDNSHGLTNIYEELRVPPRKRNLFSKGPVILENNVWIGDKATICPNVVIGEGCVIGANSVVTNDIPPYSIAAGAPARVIKKLTK